MESTPPIQDKATTFSGKKIKRNTPRFTQPSKFVTIVVDTENEKQTFTVHKQLISYHSPFFKAAFEGSYIEGQTQNMRLEDVDARTFGLLVHWLYTREVVEDEAVPLLALTLELTGGTGEPARADVPDLMPLAKLWLFAQRCLMPKLQNAVMAILHDIIPCANGHSLQNFIAYAYQSELPDTPLKRLSVDRLVWMPSKSFAIWAKDRMLVDVAVASKEYYDIVEDSRDTMLAGELCLGTADKYFVDVLD